MIERVLQHHPIACAAKMVTHGSDIVASDRESVCDRGGNVLVTEKSHAVSGGEGEKLFRLK